MSTTPVIFDDGSRALVAPDKLQGALKDGGKIAQPMQFDDGSRAYVSLDKVQGALHDGGMVIGMPPQKPQNGLDTATVQPSMLDKIGDAAKGVARSVYQVSAPGIATSLLKQKAPDIANKLPQVMRDNATPAQLLPNQLMETGLPMMLGDEVPVRARVAEEAPAVEVVAKPAPSPLAETPKPAAPAPLKGTPVWRDATLNKRNIPEYAGEGEDAAPSSAPAKQTSALEQAAALKQPVAKVVDSVIPPSNKAANMQAHAQVDFYLQKGDVAGAEKALDNFAEKAKIPDWPPERPAYAGTTNDIRAKIQQNPTQSDAMDDHAIQQEMSADLQQHGWSAESEARREFIARNSTGVTKGDLVKAGGGTVPEKPVVYTKTPGVNYAPEEDLTTKLEESVRQAKLKKQQRAGR